MRQFQFHDIKYESTLPVIKQENHDGPYLLTEVDWFLFILNIFKEYPFLKTSKERTVTKTLT
jgi:hypothetical protein